MVLFQVKTKTRQQRMSHSVRHRNCERASWVEPEHMNEWALNVQIGATNKQFKAMIHNLSRDGFLISSTASNRSDNLFKKFTHLSQSRQSVQSIHHWVKYLLEVLTFPQTNYSSKWNKHSCYKIITVPTEPLKTNHNNWTTTTILKWVNKTKASWIV